VARPDLLLIGRPAEPVLLDLANPGILQSHVLCAAAELPLTPGDIDVFGAPLGDAMQELRKQSALIPVLAGASDSGTCTPAFKAAAWAATSASRANIRAIDAVVYRLIDETTGGVLDEVEVRRRRRGDLRLHADSLTPPPLDGRNLAPSASYM